jgi:hypothetical protein
LQYREATEKERTAFRRYLRQIAARLDEDVWSPDLELEVRAELDKAQAELEAHAGSLRKAYKDLFRRSVIGVGVAAAPLLLNLVIPGVPAIIAFAFGSGGAVLVDPVKDLIDVWTGDGKPAENGLTYLLGVRSIA